MNELFSDLINKFNSTSSDTKGAITGFIFCVLLVIALAVGCSADNTSNIEKEHKRLSTHYDQKFCINACIDDKIYKIFKSKGASTSPIAYDKTLKVLDVQCTKFVGHSTCIIGKYGGYELLDGHQ